ncbi:hypothetical protein HRbin11_01295 [bacterium HR11]|nr:hypothetical protein HRbin11_01295 [bacterium HR11]
MGTDPSLSAVGSAQRLESVSKLTAEAQRTRVFPSIFLCVLGVSAVKCLGKAGPVKMLTDGTARWAWARRTVDFPTRPNCRTPEFPNSRTAEFPDSRIPELPNSRIMRMVIGLSCGALLGWLAWLGLALGQTLGWTGLSTHVLAGLGVALWNMLIQSMTLFMWMALTRQVREQAAGRPDLQATVESLRRWRNRLFPWMALGLPLWMVPLFTGMARAVGQVPTGLHRASAWTVVGLTGILTAAELRGAVRLIRGLVFIDSCLRGTSLVAHPGHDGPPAGSVD